MKYTYQILFVSFFSFLTLTASPSFAEIDSLNYISNQEPLTCGSNEYDMMNFRACKSSVGAYQFSRIALAVESYSLALKKFGFKDSLADLQAELFRDVATFGLEFGLTQSAMSLADLAAQRSKFSLKNSDAVLGFSLMTLEYLYPGLGEKTGYSLSKISELTSTKIVNENIGFQTFLKQSFTGLKSISDLRAFDIGEPSEIVKILQIPKDLLENNDSELFAADFQFSGITNFKTERPFPIGDFAVASLATSGNTGLPLFDSFPEQPSTNKDLPAPFGGATCAICKVKPEEYMGSALDNGVHSIIRDQISIKKLGGIGHSKGGSDDGTVHMTPVDGLAFISSERNGSSLKENNERYNSQYSEGEWDFYKKCELPCVADYVAIGLVDVSKKVYKLFTEEETINNYQKYKKSVQDVLTGKYYHECIAKCAMDEIIKNNPNDRDKPEKPGKTDKPEKPGKTDKPKKPGQFSPSNGGSNNKDLTSTLAITRSPDGSPDSGTNYGNKGIVDPRCYISGGLRCGCGINLLGELTTCMPEDDYRRLPAETVWISSNPTERDEASLFRIDLIESDQKDDTAISIVKQGNFEFVRVPIKNQQDFSNNTLRDKLLFREHVNIKPFSRGELLRDLLENR